MTLLAIRTKAFGPLRALVLGLPLRGFADRVASRVPARRPGNFHLGGQMKVTKAKALKAKPFMRSARCGAPARRATWKPPCASGLQRARRRGLAGPRPRNAHADQGRREASPRRVRGWADRPRYLQVARWAGPAKHVERTERCCIQPLCFGDSHLGPQMKVTRPPGRDPADHANNPPSTTQNNRSQLRAASSPPLCPDRVTHHCRRSASWSH